MTRGIRNNNPLNIRYAGSNHWVGKITHDKRDKDFEEFGTMEEGFLAAFHLLERYILKKHLTTPTAIISTWAPSNENNTHKYIHDVCAITGIGGCESLSNHDARLKDLVWAMAQIESGKEIGEYRSSLEHAWERYEPQVVEVVKERNHIG